MKKLPALHFSARLAALILAFGAAAAITAAPASVFAEDWDSNANLTHYFDFNESDSNQKTATDKITNDTFNIEGSAKIYKNKLLFPANDGSSCVRLDKEMIADGQTELTVAAWVYRSIYENDTNATLFSFGQDSSRRVFYSVDNKNDTQKFGLRKSGVWNDELAVSINSSPVLIGKWHHLAISLDSENKFHAYLDGEERNTNAPDPLPDGYGIDIFKGTDNYIGLSGYGFNCFDGFVDDFRIYDKALTAEQIKALAENPPVDCADLISIGEPSLGLANAGEEQGEALSVEYTVDFSDAFEAINAMEGSGVSGKKYLVEAEYLNSDGEWTSAGNDADVTETVSAPDSGRRVTVELSPSNPNVPCRIKASVTFHETEDQTFSIVTDNGTTLYEEVISDLARPGAYGAGSALSQNRLRLANAVIAAGGLADIAGSLDEVRAKIMKAEADGSGETVITIKEPFHSLGIGFLYSKGKLYVGDTEVGSGDEGTVYRSITLGPDNVVTLGDAVGAPADSHGEVTVSLNESEYSSLEGLAIELKADNAVFVEE